MQSDDLFSQIPIFNEELLFKEEVKVVYTIDYFYLFNCLRYLSYDEYLKIRNRTINRAYSRREVESSEDAKQRYWERIINHLESTYNFERPKSNSKDAERMRRKRGGI
jgi:hypothetical protein